jgi:hypothetical protein
LTLGFSRTSKGIAASFDVAEAGLLRRLALDLEYLLEEPEQQEAEQPGDPLEQLTGIFDGPVSTPDDPVLARLLPDAYRDDDQAASDFRRFTESELRSGKIAHSRAVRETLPAGGGNLLLDDDQAASWLAALNDIRLALGTALGVGPETEQEYAELDPNSARSRRLDIYHWLSELQSTLIHAIAGDRRRRWL